MEAFGIIPDLVSGAATNTRAGVELIKKLCAREAVNVLDSGSGPVIGDVLARTLEIPELSVGESPAHPSPLVPT